MLLYIVSNSIFVCHIHVCLYLECLCFHYPFKLVNLFILKVSFVMIELLFKLLYKCEKWCWYTNILTCIIVRHKMDVFYYTNICYYPAMHHQHLYMTDSSTSGDLELHIRVLSFVVVFPVDHWYDFYLFPFEISVLRSVMSYYISARVKRYESENER